MFYGRLGHRPPHPHEQLGDADHASGSAPAPPPLLMAVGGEAEASGQQTATTGSLAIDIEHVGRGTVAVGEAVFLAAAAAPNGAGTAAAQTFAAVSGAQIVFELALQEHGTSGTQSWSAAAVEVGGGADTPTVRTLAAARTCRL